MRSPLSPGVIQYLLEVADAGSIRRAADRLFVSPSSVNRQILNLEERVGTPLFERQARGMKATRAGEIILAAAKEFERSFNDALDQVGALRTLGSGRTSFGSLNCFADSFVAPLIVELRTQHPQLALSYYGGNSADIVQKILESDLDFGLCWDPPLSTPIRRLATMDIPVGVTVKPGHTLSGRKSVHLRDCLEYSVVFPSRGMEFRNVLDRINLGMGKVIAPAIEANSIPALRRLCILGDEPVMMTADAVLDELESGELSFVPLSDAGCSQLTLALFERTDGHRQEASELLFNALQTQVEILRSRFVAVFSPA